MIAYQRAGGVGLTPEEAASFAAHEATLAAGLHLWQTAGSALLAIRDARLFRARAASFEEYCRARWSLPERQAGRLIAHAQVYAQLRAEAQVVLRSASGKAKEISPLLWVVAAGFLLYFGRGWIDTLVA